MDKNLTSRIGISLVYDSSMWHKIINEGIAPFLKDEKIEGYSLKLSNKMGDHIRLILGTNKKKCIRLAEKADSYFKDFLLKNPSYRTNKSLEGQKLFLDFENNTIHYGAFPYSNLIDINDKYLFFSQGLSLTLIQVFQHYRSATIENIFEIIFELLTTFCNSINLKKVEALSFFDHLVKQEYKKYKSEALEHVKKRYSENFENNKVEICEYLKDNWGVSHNKIELWKAAWFTTVKTYSENINRINKNDYYYHIINDLVDTFNFSENSVMAYYLLSRGLSCLK